MENNKMIFFLYAKTHNNTGLKYLGATASNDPYKYKGSGIHWKHHIKKYGNNVTTEIIGAFDNKEDLQVAGLFWSQQWNIIESKEWANRVNETGFPGHKGLKAWNKGLTKKDDIRISGYAQTISKIRKQKFANNTLKNWNDGLTKSTSEILAKTGQKISKATKGREPWNKGVTKKDDIRMAIAAQNQSKTLKKQHALGLRKSWNTGLTKETDERLAKIAQKISNSRKGIIPWNKKYKGY